MFLPTEGFQPIARNIITARSLAGHQRQIIVPSANFYSSYTPTPILCTMVYLSMIPVGVLTDSYVCASVRYWYASRFVAYSSSIKLGAPICNP